MASLYDDDYNAYYNDNDVDDDWTEEKGVDGDDETNVNKDDDDDDDNAL